MLAFLALAVAPKWLDASLAGYALAFDETHKGVGVADPKTGYYLVRTIECDGGLLGLVLTRDRHVVAQDGYAVPSLGKGGDLKLTIKPLPSLRTGKGVVIGDAPGAVRARLGAPTKVVPHGRFLDYVYAAPVKAYDARLQGDLSAKHEQRYTFKAGRLIEISFFRDATDGAG